MHNPTGPIKCYVAAFHHLEMDPFYEKNGFSRGMILFAVPAYGILFKCRADGNMIDLEFGAFFALLRFLQTQLRNEKIQSLLVLSSNPEFVFSFAGRGRHLKENSARDRLIREHSREFKIAVSYIEPRHNPCLISPADFPSVPRDCDPVLKPNLADQDKFEFKPIQKGIKI